MIIPGFSKYDITEDGIVTDAATGRVLPQHTSTIKADYVYKRVSVVDDEGCRKQVSVIKLLALAFLGTPKCPSVARTKDGDNTNTVLSNVEWVACNSHAYQQGRCKSRKRRKPCYNTNSVALVYDTLRELDEPVSVSALSRLLELPYSVVRYSVYTLIERGRIQRTKHGVEVLE